MEHRAVVLRLGRQRRQRGRGTEGGGGEAEGWELTWAVALGFRHRPSTPLSCGGGESYGGGSSRVLRSCLVKTVREGDDGFLPLRA